jgi:hypothetical protein
MLYLSKEIFEQKANTGDLLKLIDRFYRQLLASDNPGGALGIDNARELCSI